MSISLLPLINYQLKFISYGKYKFNWIRFCNYCTFLKFYFSSINRLICFNKLAKEQKIPSINDIRPIATTSNIVKIFEFIIKDDLTLLNNSFKSNLNQIGFK